MRQYQRLNTTNTEGVSFFEVHLEGRNATYLNRKGGWLLQYFGGSVKGLLFQKPEMEDMTRVLLTGGTGQLGKMLQNNLNLQHFTTDVLTREKRLASNSNIGYINADLTGYTSLANALARHYDVVVHCASNPHQSDAVDVKGTQNLLKAVGNRNVKNFIYISIVGVDKAPYQYYQHKLEAEELIINSGISYTILRVTQFHDFVLNRILDAGNRNDVVVIPAGLRFQPIDLADVCKKIGQLIDSGPANSILQIGGPEILEISDIVEEYQHILRPAKRIQYTRSLNDFQTLFTTGINLCPDQKWGSITWENYLLSLSLTQPSAKEHR